MPLSPPVITAALPVSRPEPRSLSSPWSGFGVISPSVPGTSCCWAGCDSGRGSDTGPPVVLAAAPGFDDAAALPVLRPPEPDRLIGNGSLIRHAVAHDDRHHPSPARRRRRPRRPAREGRRPRPAVRRLRRLGGGERHGAVPGPGGGADR